MTDDKNSPKSTDKPLGSSNNPYEADIRKWAGASWEQIQKMTPKQKAKVEESRRWCKAEDANIAKAQKAARKAEKKNTEQRVREEKKKRDAEAAAIRGSAAHRTQITPGKVARFLWMPQVNVAFRNASSTLNSLVLVFARGMASAGLLPPDHPALAAGGARILDFFKILREARLNLLPLRALREKATTGPNAGIQTLAIRQYAIVTSTIGMMISIGLAVLYGLAHLILGSAHADPISSAATSGIALNGCPTSSTTTDLASACLDGVFGTGGVTTSLVGNAGLGKMLAAYSSTVLVVAGIMVLWIIVSAVAETARTGTPFGKNFNPVWAPIRLVVALGLLVPLPAGLNSGQYITIALAKWGSAQATTMWDNFANGLTSSSSSSGSSSSSSSSSNNVSGLSPSAVPFSTAPLTQAAAKMFNTLLCAAITDKVCNASGDCQSTSDYSAKYITVKNGVITNMKDTASGGDYINNSGTSKKYIFTEYRAGDSSTGGSNCGAIAIPFMTSSDLAASSTSSGYTAEAAPTATETFLTSSNANAATLASSLKQVATNVANAVVASDGTVNKPFDLSSYYSDYQTAVNAYVSGQAQAVSSAVSSYNTTLSTDIGTLSQKYGWVYSPVWIATVAQDNASLLGALQNMPVVQTPDANKLSTSAVYDAYISAQAGWNPSVTTDSSSTSSNILSSNKQDNIITDIKSMTTAVASSPLAAAGTWGRQMIVDGLILVQPKVVECNDITASELDPKSSGYSASIAAQYGQDCGEIAKARSNFHEGSHSVVPSLTDDQNTNLLGVLNADKTGSSAFSAVTFPLGMIMFSMGLLLTMSSFIPMLRFILGILNWISSVFVAVMAVPMLALSLLTTSGDGFGTQQFNTNLGMLLGVILRPVLMTIGMVLGLDAFNAIMQIVAAIFAPSVQGMTAPTDNSLLTMGIYLMVFATMTYTLANSAFKLIDMLPNWVMTWIGARLETHVDDAAQIQQQTQSYAQTLAYSSKGAAPNNPAGTGAGGNPAQGKQQPKSPGNVPPTA